MLCPQLQKTNDAQRRYYCELLPSVFASLQELDERRTAGLRGFVLRAAQVERDILPIVGQCLDGATRAADSINEKEVGQNDATLPIMNPRIGRIARRGGT
jgi:hypothetical protein